MKTNLLKGDAIVLKEQEAIVADGLLDLLHQAVNDSRIVRVEQRQVDGAKLGKVVRLLGDRRRNPLGNLGLAGQVS
jgi:hypothetical protein